jgi:ribose/xylose/arabinose/galactoside ABC-type transport system permease subunit
MESNMSDTVLTPARRPNGLRHTIEENRELVTIYGILLLFIGVGALISPDFRTPHNAFNVLRQAVALGLVSIGQTVVILAAGIDLSVGATISLVAVYVSGLMAGRPGLTVVVPIVLLMVGVSLLIGFVNALIINELKVAPFIATLGMGSVIQGLVLLYAKHPVGRISPGWDYLAEGMIGPVPFPVIFLILLVALTGLMLTRTTLGRHITATGGDEVIARWSGIRTRRIIFFAYMFCSFAAALTGLFLTSRMAIGDPQVGGLNYDRFDLDSIAAVLIGGTRLGGGKGSAVGTLGGVLILSVLNNIFNLVGVSSFYQWGIKGFIILGAVTIYTIRMPKK